MANFLAGLLGQQQDQSPAFQQQVKADRAALDVQSSLAERLGGAFAGLGTGRPVADVLASRGALSPEQAATAARTGRTEGLDPEAQASLQRDLGERGVVRQEEQQRSDLGNIFGRSLAQGVGVSGLRTGALKEMLPKRSGFDQSLDAFSNILGSVFG